MLFERFSIRSVKLWISFAIYLWATQEKMASWFASMTSEEIIQINFFDVYYLTVLRPWQTRTHCCGHIVANTNVSPFAHARNICCGHKMFLILFRNILCPQQMFPSLRNPRNIMGNNVSTTRCPRLPGPLGYTKTTIHPLPPLWWIVVKYIIWLSSSPVSLNITQVSSRPAWEARLL